MSLSTMSGPLRTGTKREGTLAAGRNVGVASLNQFYDSGDLTGTAVGNVDVLIGNLPQGALITDIYADQYVAATAGTMTVQVGTSVGDASLMAATATTAGGRFRGASTAATQAAWITSTTADTPLYVRIAVGTATLTAGKVLVNVVYAQRLPDGTVVKTQVTS